MYRVWGSCAPTRQKSLLPPLTGPTPKHRGRVACRTASCHRTVCARVWGWVYVITTSWLPRIPIPSKTIYIRCGCMPCCMR